MDHSWRSPNQSFGTWLLAYLISKQVFKNGGTLDAYILKMEKKISELGTRVGAIGECGLDYDRLFFSNKEDQLAVFPVHFDLAEKFQLPMYLHSRNCEEDFLSKILSVLNLLHLEK